MAADWNAPAPRRAGLFLTRWQDESAVLETIPHDAGQAWSTVMLDLGIIPSLHYCEG